MPPHLKDKNQEETFFWGEGGVCTKATCPCEQRAYCLIERKGETDGCNTEPTFFGNGMNFSEVTVMNKSYVRNRISEHLTVENVAWI